MLGCGEKPVGRFACGDDDRVENPQASGMCARLALGIHQENSTESIFADSRLLFGTGM